MRDEADFYPFHPRGIRIGLFVCAVASLVLAAWALADARHLHTASSAARAGIYAGLTAAFLYPFFQLRPRGDWGVTLASRELRIARPLSGSAIVIPWEHVSHVRRGGRGGRVLQVVLEAPAGRVLLARHLFARTGDYEALFSALQARKPPRRLDA